MSIWGISSKLDRVKSSLSASALGAFIQWNTVCYFPSNQSHLDIVVFRLFFKGICDIKVDTLRYGIDFQYISLCSIFIQLFIYNLYLLSDIIIYNFPDDSDGDSAWLMCVHDDWEKMIDDGWEWKKYGRPIVISLPKCTHTWLRKKLKMDPGWLHSIVRTCVHISFL